MSPEIAGVQKNALKSSHYWGTQEAGTGLPRGYSVHPHLCVAEGRLAEQQQINTGGQGPARQGQPCTPPN